MNDRLYRSRDDRLLAGVAGGLAEYWDADPSLIRIVWALLAIFTGGIALLVYVVMAIVVPEDPGVPVFQAGVSVTLPPTADWRAQRTAHRSAAREARRQARAARADGPRTGTLIVGAVLVLLGAWFLLEEFVPSFNADLFWPLALVALGVLIVAMAVRPSSTGIAPAGPAAPPATPPPGPPAAGDPAPDSRIDTGNSAAAPANQP